MDILRLLGRQHELFEKDIENFAAKLQSIVEDSRFLVIGGGGSIGQAVCRQLFVRKAKALHVVDLNENYLVELVRDIRSHYGYVTKDFDTFALDCGSESFTDFIAKGNYDYILNLSAMKHVRSENCTFSIERMIKVNILNVLSTYNAAVDIGAKKYFCVSTDKAANPANFMGATKRAMELCLMNKETKIPISGARFANVAFSNGSLLEGFLKRIEKRQPLSLPSDVRRFFISDDEAGIICMFSALLGDKNQIFFPHNSSEIKLTFFKDVAYNFLYSLGKKPIDCYNEQDARDLMLTVDTSKYWPVNLFSTDTAGEKPFEEFYTPTEVVNFNKFEELAMIDFKPEKTLADVKNFLAHISSIKPHDSDARDMYFEIMHEFVPTFQYRGAKRFLNSRM